MAPQCIMVPDGTDGRLCVTVCVAVRRRESGTHIHGLSTPVWEYYANNESGRRSSFTHWMLLPSLSRSLIFGTQPYLPRDIAPEMHCQCKALGSGHHRVPGPAFRTALALAHLCPPDADMLIAGT